MKRDPNTINRREFLRHSAAASLGSAFFVNGFSMGAWINEMIEGIGTGLFHIEQKAIQGVSPIAQIKSDITSTVSVVASPSAVNDNGQINPQIVQQMLDKAILDFTGKTSIEAAWNDIIPNLKSTDTIGIKVNCINPSLPTSPQVVSAIIDHLARTGVNPNNIIVWDRSDSSVMGLGSLKKSGYTPNSSDKGVKYISTATDTMGYDDAFTMKVPSQDLSFPVSRIFTRECKYLINVPQLRSHGRAGVTNCMKNFYGVIPLFDQMTVTAANKMHARNGNPAIPELYNNPIVKEKTVLHVSDALMTLYQGGPMGTPQCVIGKILVGKDPVALDYLGLQLIEIERKKRGLDSLMTLSKYIQTAAEMGLGTNNLSQMTIKASTV